MPSRKTLRQLLEESNKCFLVPCVYDCAPSRAVEMCGFPASLLSGGKVSISLDDVINYGFTNLTDLEWVVSRVSQTSSVPLIADIGNGFGGSLVVYRSARCLPAAGAATIQLEDAGDMEDTCKILPREKYLTKAKTAVEVLKGTNCLLIAHSNADPYDPEQMKEGCERLRIAMEIGADMAVMVLITTLDKAKEMAELVPSQRIFVDVWTDNGALAAIMDDLTPLGSKICSTHYIMKTTMGGMLEHDFANFKDQSVTYTFTYVSGTSQPDFSTDLLFVLQDYLELENLFIGEDKEYTIMGHEMAPYSDGFKRIDIKDRP